MPKFFVFKDKTGVLQAEEITLRAGEVPSLEIDDYVAQRGLESEGWISITASSKCAAVRIAKNDGLFQRPLLFVSEDHALAEEDAYQWRFFTKVLKGFPHRPVSRRTLPEYAQ